MKYYLSIITLITAAFLVCGTSARGQNSTGRGTGRGQGIGQGTGRGEQKPQKQQTVATTTVTESVNITLTTADGSIIVRGWDRSELRAQTKGPGTKIELRSAGEGESAHPVTHVEVLVSDKPGAGAIDDESGSVDSDVTIDVPRGATLYLKTQDGDVDVEDVAEAHVETSGGRIDLRRVSKATEATSLEGDVTLEDSKGRARLNSLGGVVGIKDLSPVDPSDFLKIKTASGDVLLDRVSSARIEANTISGEVKLMGQLVRGGVYSFTTTIGDITLVLGSDSSFKLNAKVSEGGEIITDFPLKYKGTASPLTLLKAGRLIGTYGTGDASVNIVSFSGTVRLRKK